MFETLLYPTLDSTNEEAKRLLNEGAIQGVTLIRAGAQTAGKGTHGRQWASPAGAGLYFSLVHPFLTGRPLAKMPEVALLTQAAGVACAETLRTLLGLPVALKPINDLYVDGRKLGGILTEGVLSGQVCRAVITGIGINVGHDPGVEAVCQQDGRENRPTSIQACVSPQMFAQWHPEALMRELSEAIAETLELRYQQVFAGQSQEVLARYREWIWEPQASGVS